MATDLASITDILVFSRDDPFLRFLLGDGAAPLPLLGASVRIGFVEEDGSISDP